MVTILLRVLWSMKCFCWLPPLCCCYLCSSCLCLLLLSTKSKRKYQAMLLIKGCIWSMLIYIFSSVIVSFYRYIYYKHLNEIIYKIDIAFMDYIFWIESFNGLKYKKIRKRLSKNHDAHANILKHILNVHSIWLFIKQGWTTVTSVIWIYKYEKVARPIKCLNAFLHLIHWMQILLIVILLH